VYTELRKWRLLRHRELLIEAYKIFPNRVLCEAVRRKRNDPCWAATGAASMANDLVQCWGIGRAKACAGGFGEELAAALEAHGEALEASRRRSADSTAVSVAGAADSAPKAE